MGETLWWTSMGEPNENLLVMDLIALWNPKEYFTSMLFHAIPKLQKHLGQ